MSLDLEVIGKTMWQPLIDYTDCPQIIRADQDIPKKKLKFPRLVFKFSEPYDTDKVNLTEMKEVVESIEEGFENDIMYSYFLNPKVRLSIDGYGSKKRKVRPYINEARNWFIVPKLANRFFEEYNGHVLRVEKTKDRTTYLETGYQNRLGFDVILEFEDVIKVREKTIESLIITSEEGSQELST